MNKRAEAIKELAEDLAAAELHGDTDFLRDVLADDFVGVGPQGFILAKEQWLARYESGSLKYEDYEIQDQFRATLVFVEKQGRWLLADLHLSPIAGKS